MFFFLKDISIPMVASQEPSLANFHSMTDILSNCICYFVSDFGFVWKGCSNSQYNLNNMKNLM